MRNKIELLAPAGSMEALVAAIQNGANAVYLGGQSFSARASANNFSNDELVEAVSYAHFRNVRLYVTVNTLLDDKELGKIKDYISFLYSIGIDGLIVQDLGLARLIRDNFSDIELHASTQMTINSLEGAKLLEENGFSRVVLARETPLSEAKLISENTNLEIEAFAHGALCVSYSGQCYMSSMIGGRSGNRGRCAQPCRKSYKVIKADGRELIDKRAYLISPMDLYTLENVDKMLEAGINSLKIEGRMKRPEYVATVTAAYRRAIDRTSLKDEEKTLKQAFNRGFTRGLPFEAFGKNFVETSRPDNRGLELGHVIKVDRNKVEIKISEDLNKGDLLEFVTKNGRKTFSSPDAYKKGTIFLKLPFEPVEYTELRRIKNEKDSEVARASYAIDKLKKEINLKFVGQIGKLPKIEISVDNILEEVFGDEIIQRGEKAPMTKEKIAKQLEKLGDTDFILKNLEIQVDENIFLPVSSLNAVRRKAIDLVLNKFLERNKREKIKVFIKNDFKNFSKKEFKLAASFEDKKTFEKINIDGIDRFYLRFLDEKIYSYLLENDKEVYFRSPKILFHNDLESISSKLENINKSGMLVDNLGSLYKFENESLIGDTGLNVFNAQAVKFLEENNIKDVILSTELTFSQISEIRKSTDAILETTGYGFLRVMTMKHCPYSTIKICNEKRKCISCNFRQGFYLRDEINVDFRTKREDDLSIIYNSYPLSIIDYLDQVRASGIDYLLLDFSFEENPQEVIDEFLKAKTGCRSDLNNRLKEKWKNITYGHYFRGVE